VNIVAGGPLGTTGRVSVDIFTNLIDAPMSFLSSLSSISQLEVKEGLGANISDGMSQFSTVKDFTILLIIMNMDNMLLLLT
jgi:hypothetical protein